MAKILLDKSLCIDCGACVRICPDVFAQTKSGVYAKYSTAFGDIFVSSIKPNSIWTARAAYRACPARCIAVLAGAQETRAEHGN